MNRLSELVVTGAILLTVAVGAGWYGEARLADTKAHGPTPKADVTVVATVAGSIGTLDIAVRNVGSTVIEKPQIHAGYSLGKTTGPLDFTGSSGCGAPYSTPSDTVIGCSPLAPRETRHIRLSYRVKPCGLFGVPQSLKVSLENPPRQLLDRGVESQMPTFRDVGCR